MTTGIPGGTTGAPLFTDVAPELEVSVRSLEGYLVRCVSFMTGVKRSPAIRRALKKRGYTTAEHKRGVALLGAVTGIGDEEEELQEDALRALVEIDNADETIFKIVTATLTRRFPKEAAVLLKGLGPSTGVEAVVNLDHLLKRIAELESGVGREATRERDQEILAILDARGFGSAERARLRKLVDLANELGPDDMSAETEEQQKKAHIENLVALRDWVMEWSEIARTELGRREQLIKLGLASPRRSKSGGVEEEAEDDMPVPPPIPAPTPAPAPAPSPVDPMD